MSNISATVKSIQDIMRQDAGIDGDAQRIGQLTWLFFLKIFDDREYETELLDADYRSPIPEELRWRTWAAPREGITGDALLDFVNNQLFPTLKQFAESATSGPASVIGNVFQDAFNYMKNGTLIRQVLNKIEEIDFNRSEDRHLFGDIYEQILKDLQSAGNSGEYYTPRAVTQFMVDMVDPKLGEKVVDPACGTGGFLTCAIEHVRANDVKTPRDEAQLQSTIRGVEKKQLPHLLCTTNMLLHGIDVPTNIAHDNTLARPLRDYTAKDRVDVIITNPPFGGTEEPGIKDNFPLALRTSETADLFLVLIEHLLKDGGRAAVVLPDGTLFGDGVKGRIKEKLLTNCNLHTVVRLPKGVFTPYTTVATNLLFFTKGEPTKEIWYYEHRYPAGSKNYSKTKPIRIEEFDAEKAWWDNRVESEVAWKVSIDDVRDDWNLDIVNPNRVDAEHRDPVEIFRENEAVSDEIAATQKCLRDALVSASARTHPELDAETFTDSFVHIAEAPGGIQRLRRLIGDLAVRGLLSESNDSDEPVIDLLERLEHRRRALESRSRRPKQKSAAEVADRPFALPAEWQWARLGDVAADIQYGLTAKASAEVLEPAFVRITDIKSSQIKWESVPGCVDSEGDVGRFRLAAGDVLVARSGATVGVSAVVRELPRAAVFASYLIRIVPVEAWLSKWWPILVGSEFYWTQVRSITTGSAQPNINSTNMRGWLIPIPPLQEQHRIVQRVEELWGLCAELEVLYATRAEVRTALASATLHRLAGDGRVRRNTRL